MITITCLAINNGLEPLSTSVYRVEYHLDGVRVSAIESSDLSVCLKEIEQKMRMDMGHLKGKIFTTYRGREL